MAQSQKPSSSNPTSTGHKRSSQNPPRTLKPHVCGQSCGMRFKREQDRDRHENNVHKGIRFKCSSLNCHRSWTRRDKAALHMRQEHPHLIDNPRRIVVDTTEAAWAYHNSSDSSPEQDPQLYNSFVQGATTSMPPVWPPSQPRPLFDDSNFASGNPSQPFTYGSEGTAVYQSPYCPTAPDQPAFEYLSPEAESPVHSRATMSSQSGAYGQWNGMSSGDTTNS